MPQKTLRVGFIGMGIMGGPMALNCRAAGFDLTVYNRTPGKTDPHRQAGAEVVDSPRAVAERSDVILSCVTASEDVLEVVLDEQAGVLAGIAKGATVIDCSTVAPSVGKQCAEALAGKGCGWLDAPVSGGDVGAQNGTLSIMCGGDREHFDRAKPVLDAMGKTVTYCGPAGSGYVVKLCNQICGAMHLLAAAEAINLAETAGVDTEAMVQAVSGGAAGSWMLDNLAPKILQRDFEPGFFVDYQLKDLRLASDACHDLSLPLPGLSIVETLFRAASAEGFGREGTQAIYKTIKSLAGKG
ncbi:MAG: NAD(P)-dependent oxidoreductase [Phycisphaerae bacterium]